MKQKRKYKDVTIHLDGMRAALKEDLYLTDQYVKYVMQIVDMNIIDKD